MLKYLFWIIIIFALALGCVSIFNLADGKLFLLINSTSYEMTLKWLFVVTLIVLVLAYLLYRILSFIFRMPRRLNWSHKQKKSNQATHEFNRAITFFFEGSYNRALSLIDGLLKNKQVGELKSAAVILGAQCADRIYDYKKRDYYLGLLPEKEFSDSILANLLLAKGSLDAQDYVEFEDYCEKVKWHNPKLTKLSQLQLAYGLQTQNAKIILSSITQLKTNNAISPADFLRYEEEGYLYKLNGLRNANELRKYVKSLPNSLQGKSSLIDSIAQHYLDLQLYDEAVGYALKEYSKNKDQKLLFVILNSFEQLSEKTQNNTIETLETWLDHDRENADLLLLLGNLSYQKGLWGKAQSYLEASASTHPTILGLTTLSKLYKEQGEEVKAVDLDQKALQIALDSE